MGQMYKIFINDKPLYLVNDFAKHQEHDTSLLVKFHGEEQIEYLVQALEKEKHVLSLMLFHSDLDALWRAFCNGYTFIQAAGGLVKNEMNEHLLIFRNGRWDLPKGKLEENETLENAALREVEEECGVTNLTLGAKLKTTYHTYEIKDKNILKSSHWYHMSCNGSAPLKPQTKEGIEKAEWMNQEQIEEARANTYGTIDEILSGLL
jgi:ADP-ribose pyrophosphatase YjhB (NUDIX family)